MNRQKIGDRVDYFKQYRITNRWTCVYCQSSMATNNRTHHLKCKTHLRAMKKITNAVNITKCENENDNNDLSDCENGKWKCSDCNILLQKQGKTDEAIAAMSAARKANPKDLNLILNEAQLYSDMDRMDKFGSLMQEAITLDPNNTDLYFNLGVVNANEGRTEEAKKYYEKAIELKPDYADAYMNLAVVVLDKDKAIVEEMNKNLSNNKKYDELALQQKEVYKEALPYLEKANSLDQNINTVKTLMNIYEVLEMTDKADTFRELYKSMR